MGGYERQAALTRHLLFPQGHTPSRSGCRDPSSTDKAAVPRTSPAGAAASRQARGASCVCAVDHGSAASCTGATRRLCGFKGGAPPVGFPSLQGDGQEASERGCGRATGRVSHPPCARTPSCWPPSGHMCPFCSGAAASPCDGLDLTPASASLLGAPGAAQQHTCAMTCLHFTHRTFRENAVLRKL